MKKGLLYSFIAIFMFITVFFSGCDFANFIPGRSSNTNDSTPYVPSLGTYSDDKEPEKKFDNEPNIDTDKIFDYFYGAKIAYDSTQYYIDLANNRDRTIALLQDIDYKLKNDGEFSIIDYVAEHPEYELNETQVSEVVWLMNLIDQYELLAGLILSDLVGAYGLGLEQNTSIQSDFYIDYEFTESVTPQSENAINFTPTTYYDNFIFNNPNFGIIAPAGEESSPDYAYSDEQSFVIDLANGQMQIGSESFAIDTVSRVAKTYKSWLLNLVGTEFESIVLPSFKFENPVYDSTATQGLCSYQYINVVGHINSNEIEYELAFDGVDIADSSDATDYLNAYLNQYKSFLAIKIFEYSQNTQNINNIMTNRADYFEDYIALLQNYLENGGKIGLPEKDWQAEVGNLSFKDYIVDLLINQFVGYDDSDELYTSALQSIQEIVEHRINQYVEITNDTAFDSTSENGEKYFASVENIEWIDIERATLLDDEYVFPYQNIVSIVLMVNEELAQERYFDTLLFYLLAQENEVELDSFLHFVQDGENKIFEKIDYNSLRKSEDEEDSEEGELNFESTFNGTITLRQEEQSDADYIDQNALYIENQYVPHINEFLNRQLIFTGFKNNSASSFAQSLTTKYAQYYVVDTESGAIYYNDNDSGCDYMELAFNASCENGQTPSFGIFFDMFALENDDEEENN